jgi:hypothetical protein
MQTITTIGLDIAKSVFQVHGVDAQGKVIVRRQLKRRHVLLFLPGFGSFLDPKPGIGIGGVLPIGTALVTEFAPHRIRARVNIT